MAWCRFNESLKLLNYSEGIAQPIFLYPQISIESRLMCAFGRALTLPARPQFGPLHSIVVA